MSEAAVNQKTMYDIVDAIHNLNSVEGFDPRNYMREIQGDGENKKYYLDVAFRKLWFRLKYPEGRISKRLLKLANDMAVIEARVYLNYRDPEENYVANAFSHKFRAEDAQFGSKFVELAETAATGRALADAGFGLQFADCEKETDPEVADAPFETRFMQTESTAGNDGDFTGEAVFGEITEAGTMQDENNLPGQHQIEEYIPMPQDVGQYMEQMTPAMSQTAGSTAAPSGTPAMQRQGQASNTAAAPVQRTAAQKPATEIDRKLPVEQIYAMLDRDSAASLVVNVGFSKGKTLGQVAVERPDSLEWYVNRYNGPDNLLRAAAKFLMDSALKNAG